MERSCIDVCVLCRAIGAHTGYGLFVCVFMLHVFPSSWLSRIPCDVCQSPFESRPDSAKHVTIITNSRFVLLSRQLRASEQ